MGTDVVRELRFVRAVGVHHPERIMVMCVRDIEYPFAIRTEGGMIMTRALKSELFYSRAGARSYSVDAENLVDVIYHSGEGDLLSIGGPCWMPIVYIVMCQLLFVCAIGMNDVDF